MGFNSPSKIQAKVLPMLLADPPNNMIVQSQSATGKTVACVLTMLNRVNPEESFPQVIYLLPTMELAKQTGAVAEQMAKYCPEIAIAYACIGGNRLARGERLTSQIIIGTAGIVMDWIVRVRAFDPKKIRVFVLDEADVMIDTQGHKDQSVGIHKSLPKDCQMLLFSATNEEQVMTFAEIIIPDPIIIRLRREESLENIRQFYVVCTGMEQKFESLSNMYGVISIGQCIVFCNTKEDAAWLSLKMSREGHSVALLSGEITVEQRMYVLDRFRAGKEKLLITTTNVCVRGLDIKQVSLVVNFDLPVDIFNAPKIYLHRIGPAGRFGRYGRVVNFVNGNGDLAILMAIEEHYVRPIEELNTNDIDALEKLDE